MGMTKYATKDQLDKVAQVTLDNDLTILDFIHDRGEDIFKLMQQQHKIIVTLSATVRELEMKVDRLERDVFYRSDSLSTPTIHRDDVTPHQPVEHEDPGLGP